jgi:hypothetical protein
MGQAKDQVMSFVQCEIHRDVDQSNQNCPYCEIESLNEQMEIMKQLVADLVGVNMDDLEGEDES